jgi:hypothetical protein
MIPTLITAVQSYRCPCGCEAETIQQCTHTSGAPIVFREVLPLGWHVVSGSPTCSLPCAIQAAREAWRAPETWEVGT